MSAELFGQKLLGEVQSESLEELIGQLRQFANPRPSDILGLPVLDKILEAFRFPEGQTAPQPLWPSPDQMDLVEAQDEEVIASSQLELEHDIFTQTTIKPATLEISSQRSASGKTILLYYLAGIAVLPTIYSGKESTVVWLDTDGRFSAARLYQILQNQLSRLDSSLPSATLSEVSLEALKHVHVFRPQSSAQLLSTLNSLPSYLLSSAPNVHFSAFRPLSLIILDSATAFNWQDRGASELARLEAGLDTGLQGQIQAPSRTTEIISHLKALQTRFSSAVIFTTTAPTPTQPNVSSTLQQVPIEPAAVSPWTAYATVSLLATRLAVPQFTPHQGIEECIRDAEARRIASAQGRFSITIADNALSSGKEKDKLKALGEDRFTVKVGKDGDVEIE